MALSCHVAPGMLCQEMHEAWWLGSAWSLVAGVLLPERSLCHSKKAFRAPWTGCDSKGEGCGERN